MKIWQDGKITYVYPDEVPRVYYRIGTAAQLLGVTTSCIRYWCNIFGLPADRNNHHDRRFTPQQFRLLQTIHKLRHQEGLKEWRIHQILREQKLLPGTRGRKKTKIQFI